MDVMPSTFAVVRTKTRHGTPLRCSIFAATAVAGRTSGAPAGGMAITRPARLEYAIELIAAVRIDRHRQIERVRFFAMTLGKICSYPAKSIAAQAALAGLRSSLLDTVGRFRRLPLVSRYELAASRYANEGFLCSANERG